MQQRMETKADAPSGAGEASAVVRSAIRSRNDEGRNKPAFVREMRPYAAVMRRHNICRAFYRPHAVALSGFSASV